MPPYRPIVGSCSCVNTLRSKYCNISTGVLVDFHMIHYTIHKLYGRKWLLLVTGEAVAIFMTCTVYGIMRKLYISPPKTAKPHQTDTERTASTIATK